MWVQSHVDRVADIRGAGQWVELLHHIDRQVNCAEGETTAVIVALYETGLCGTSVGDSVAWIVGESIDELTENQKRRPFVGTGKAEPIGFEREGFAGTLMLASDGLANYAERRKIVETLRMEDMTLACEQLVNLVRLKSGALWDDVGIVLCRRGEVRKKCEMEETKAFVIE
jgi:serine/threonine protein phosphatase PrpC